MSGGVSRRDVPYFAHPVLSCAGLLSIPAMLAFAIAHGELRPGLLELAAGLGFGLISGYLCSRIWLIGLARMALRVQKDPSMKWGSLITGPFTGYSALQISAVVALIVIAGLCGMGALMHHVLAAYPDLRWPVVACMAAYTHGEECESASASSALMIYLLTFWAVQWCSMLIWYRRLPG